MKRREFLYSGLIAASTAVLAPRFALAQVSGLGSKVIVIGGGLAGLVAAYELSKLRYDVTVLEAQERPGGRVLTLRDFGDGVYADAGAARIPSDHDLTHKYVREFALPLIPFYPNNGKFMRLVNGNVEQTDWDKFREATRFVMGLGNADHWQKIEGGNDLLPKAFAERLREKIRYSVPVVKIEPKPNGIVVTFRERDKLQTLSANLLLCAIPFTMLAKIDVSPSFSPAKMEAIRRTRMDSASRVFLETKRRFWLDKGVNGFAFGDDFAEIWNSTLGEPGSHGIVQTYVRSGYSTSLGQLPEAERIASTAGKLRKFFPELDANFVKGRSKCWSEDPWVLGAWANGGGGSGDGQMREGNVFFAGEHLSNHGSWMQGALESGLRVVSEITTARQAAVA
jgi:monoamine oxidase